MLKYRLGNGYAFLNAEKFLVWVAFQRAPVPVRLYKKKLFSSETFRVHADNIKCVQYLLLYLY